MASDSPVRARRWLAAVALVLTAVAIGSSTLNHLNAQNMALSQTKTVSIPLEGMSCVSCAARVKRTLKGINGVEHVEVSLEHRQAVVRFLPDKVTSERLETAINDLGYKAGKSRMVESK
jgi:copper chaperone CopZ